MTFGSCDSLTAREREVLTRLADGESNRQIAKHLAIAPATARTHTQNVLAKLGVQSRVQAIASAHPAADPGSALIPESGDQNPISRLTRRERQVLAHLAEGLTRASIATRLNVSPNTVRTHVRNILAKLGVHSTPEAVALVRKREREHEPGGLTRPG